MSRFLVRSYLKTGGTQYSMRVQDASGLVEMFPELGRAMRAGREWQLPKKAVTLQFNGTPMQRSDTTLSFYPKPKYVEFNVNRGNALFTFLERKQGTDDAGIYFDAECRKSGSGTRWVINLTLVGST